MIFRLILILAMLILTILVVHELVAFVQKRSPYSLRRLTLRLSMAIMMLFLLGSIFLGIYSFHLATPEDSADPRLWAAFWGSITVLTLGILCLVMADFRTINDETGNDTTVLWHDIAETIATHEALQKKDQ